MTVSLSSSTQVLHTIASSAFYFSLGLKMLMFMYCIMICLYFYSTVALYQLLINIPSNMISLRAIFFYVQDIAYPKRNGDVFRAIVGEHHGLKDISVDPTLLTSSDVAMSEIDGFLGAKIDGDRIANLGLVLQQQLWSCTNQASK